MPAEGLSNGKSYYHVYNCGVEKRVIFNDAQDYQTFESYLSEYLTPPVDPASVKKTFTVHGRTFKGTPHQPKNHHGKIELLGYSLMPNHFHLVLGQSGHGPLESFIRSLCTRYSMYFNKKYARRGSLFEGPYKSVHIGEENKLFPLISFIHHGTNDYSSYPEYMGKRVTSWVNTNVIPSDQKEITSQPDVEALRGLTIEDDSQPLERRDLAEKSEKPVKPARRVPEMFAITTVFFILLGLGFRNVSMATNKNLASTSPTESAVLSESTESTKPAESTQSAALKGPLLPPETKTSPMIVVRITNGSQYINIRQSPSTDSEKVGVAKDGDTFELISENSGWFEIKLENNLTGFILSDLAVRKETNTNE